MSTILTSGYFTLARYVTDLDANALENRLGFQPGALSGGFSVAVPLHPIAPENIQLKGSTRWSGGKLSSGKNIDDIIAGRTNADNAREKVAGHFQRGISNTPVKLFRNSSSPIEFPDAPVGVPQFRTDKKVEWRVVLDVPSGAILRRSDLLPLL